MDRHEIGISARATAATQPTALVLATLIASCIALQVVLYSGPLRNAPSHSTRYAVSGAIGLLHGRGFTTAAPEAVALLGGVDHERDLLPLWAPEAEREPAQEPMPGVTLVFAALGELFGRLRLADVVTFQIVAYALLCGALYLALRPLDPVGALLGAVGWALFVPHYRVTLSPGHDAMTSLAYLGSLLPMLRHQRTGGLGSAAAAGVVCGLGLWLREFFLLLPPIYALVLLAFSRRRWAALAVFLLPVALAAGSLAYVRSHQEGAAQRFARGGLWHNFFTGVGQFSNPLGIEGHDASVRAFAERVSGEDYDFPNYQYDPGYNETLAAHGEPYVRERWPSLLRNAVYRVGWLFVPALMPSGSFAASLPVRLLLLGFGIPVVILASLGARKLWRRDPALPLILLAPWLSIFPLALYTFNAKVPTQVFFGAVVLAAFAVVDPVRGLTRSSSAWLRPEIVSRLHLEYMGFRSRGAPGPKPAASGSRSSPA